MSSSVLSFLKGGLSSHRSFSLVLFGAALVALCLTSPSSRQQNNEALQHTTGWIVLADVSKSMTLNDIAPSRLAAMRDAIQTLTERAGAKSVALIVYAGDAFLAVPPVFDKSLLVQHTALLDYGIVPHDGSNLTRALALATAVIEDSGMLRTRVFVLSDGAGMNNSSNAAARHLVNTGHQVDTLLFGTNTGENATSVSVKTAEQFTKAGDGKLAVANRLGAISFDSLKLATSGRATQVATVRALYWKNQSHWLLLLLLPFALLWFRQES